MSSTAAVAATLSTSAPIMAIVARYEAWKTAIALWIGIDDWLIHAQFGMIIFVFTAIALRRPLASLPPISCVLASEAMNEWMDRLNYGSWRWPDTSRDLVFTLAWPLILFLCSRTGLLRRA